MQKLFAGFWDNTHAFITNLQNMNISGFSFQLPNQLSCKKMVKTVLCLFKDSNVIYAMVFQNVPYTWHSDHLGSFLENFPIIKIITFCLSYCSFYCTYLFLSMCVSKPKFIILQVCQLELLLKTFKSWVEEIIRFCKKIL